MGQVQPRLRLRRAQAPSQIILVRSPSDAMAAVERVLGPADATQASAG